MNYITRENLKVFMKAVTKLFNNTNKAINKNSNDIIKNKEQLKLKADLVNGKVPKEQLPNDVGMQSDWNQNDETASDYIKNRICYDARKIIVPEEEREFKYNGYGYSRHGPNINDYLILHNKEKIKVLWDSQNYEVEINGLNFGNLDSYPFYYEGAKDAKWSSSSWDSPHTFAVFEAQSGELVKIPKKFIDESFFGAGKRRNNFNEVFNNFDNIVSGIYSHAEGCYTTASGNYSHAEGYSTETSGDSSHAEGNHTTASGKYSHAEGERVIASGKNSHAEGEVTTASGDNSHSEGYYTLAIKNGSHAEGNGTATKGENSHAEGWHTETSGKNSHAEGEVTTASGDSSHAEGNHTTASGKSSHAEGNSTTASSGSSHAEGSQTEASGDASHAEGYETKASGYDSHSEGFYTKALGDYSHAEGNEAVASGKSSHAEGNSTTASSDYQHVQGKYNIDDPSGKYAHIVGNGKYDTSTWTSVLSNAHTLDWQGNSWYQGDVLSGGTDMDDPNAISLKKVAEQAGRLPVPTAQDKDKIPVVQPDGNYALMSQTGGEEKWEDIWDFTVEQEVTRVEYKFLETPMKKLRIFIHSMNNEVDTNYSGITLWTSDVVWNTKVDFYPKALPRKLESETYIEAEILKYPDGNYAKISGRCMPFAKKGTIASFENTSFYGGVWKPIDNYDNNCKDKFTGFTMGTYQKFIPGTRFVLQGVK